MMNCSIILILNRPVAKRKTEESITIFVLEWLAVVWHVVASDHPVLFALRGVLVDNDLAHDFAVFQEHVQGRLTDWNDLFDNIPEDALSEWRRRKRSLVGPPPVEVELADKLVHVQLFGHVFGSFDFLLNFDSLGHTDQALNELFKGFFLAHPACVSC